MVELDSEVRLLGDPHILQVKHGASSSESHRQASPAVLTVMSCHQANTYCSQPN